MTHPDTAMRKARTVDELMAPLIAQELRQAELDALCDKHMERLYREQDARDETRRREGALQKQRYQAKVALGNTLTNTEKSYWQRVTSTLKPLAAAATIILGLSSFKKTEPPRFSAAFENIDTKQHDYEQLLQGRFAPAVQNCQLTSIVGERKLPEGKHGTTDHEGNDLACPAGTKLYAPIDGVVTKRYGYVTIIENPVYQVQFHHTTNRLKVGDTVTVGQPVGKVVLKDPSDPTYQQHAHIGVSIWKGTRFTPINYYCTVPAHTRTGYYPDVRENQISAIKPLRGVTPADTLNTICDTQAQHIVNK